MLLAYIYILYYLMAEKAIWLDIARVCVCIFTSRRRVKYSTRVQYPAILPSQQSNNRFIIYHSDFSSIQKIDSYCTCELQRPLLRVYLISFRLLACFELLTAPEHAYRSFTSGKKVPKSVNNAVFNP